VRPAVRLDHARRARRRRGGARTDPEACRRDRGGLADFIKLDRELMSQLDAITKVIATERDGQLALPETP
jgi:hypothetical protein